MPPKVKIAREHIINTAVHIVRNNGADAINARVIAKALHCSTQPVFSNFSTMEELHRTVMDVADSLYQEYTKNEIESGKYPKYKATGMAYIRFAKEERELFKLLFMRNRSAEKIPALSKEISDIVQDSTGLDRNSAERFHLEIWAFVHGIAAMIATNYLELDMGLVSEMLTDAYYGMKTRYDAKGDHNGRN